ncbi:hypothetical protein GCM10023324_21320 [Streptomyces youssoufiensis]
MGVLRLFQRVGVALRHVAFPHDVEVAVECGGELPRISVEFHIAGASQRTILADLFMVANELYLPALRSFGTALSEECPSQSPGDARDRDDH